MFTVVLLSYINPPRQPKKEMWFTNLVRFICLTIPLVIFSKKRCGVAKPNAFDVTLILQGTCSAWAFSNDRLSLETREQGPPSSVAFWFRESPLFQGNLPVGEIFYSIWPVSIL